MLRSSSIAVGNRSTGNNSNLIDVSDDIDVVELDVEESEDEPLTICIASGTSKLNLCFGRPAGRDNTGTILVCSVNCLHFYDMLGCSDMC